MHATAPRRRRDALASIDAIERAATELVLEHGYDAVTVEMICERAGTSARTFYNHFGTKETALLGLELPSIDERSARAFIVDSGPLLLGAARLVGVAPGRLADDPAELLRRARAIGSSPELTARQLGRIETLLPELTDILVLRLRAQHPEDDDADRASQAALIAQLVLAVLRVVAADWARQSVAGADPTTDPAQTAALLERVVGKLP